MDKIDNDRYIDENMPYPIDSVLWDLEDILEEFGIINAKEEEHNQKIKIPKIKKEYEDIYNLILYTPTNLQYITNKSGINISEINQKLTILELEGYIKSLPGNNYVRI